MKYNDILLQKKLSSGSHILSLDAVYPVHLVPELPHTKWIDDQVSKTSYANRIEVEVTQPCALDVRLDRGWVAHPDEAFTNRFLNDELWQGGDGIYSFNLNDGRDAFGPQEAAKTLFVFGDTFVGSYHPTKYYRFLPTLMPNNSLALMEKDTISFKIHLDDGVVSSFFTIAPEYNQLGTLATNLLKDDESVYLAHRGLHPVVLTFDFNQITELSHLELANYYDATDPLMNQRGFKKIRWEISDDNVHYTLLKESSHAIASAATDIETVPLACQTRYVKATVLHAHHDGSTIDQLVGARYVSFKGPKRSYHDIQMTATPPFELTNNTAWLWLQDGLVIHDHFYFIPMRVMPDETQPEGLQFKVIGTMLFAVPIRDHGLDFSAVQQKPAHLFKEIGASTFLFGAAIMNHSEADGYIYIYGYKATMGLRELIVARVQKESFWWVDTWMFYSADGWSSELTDSTPVLPHVSCEMSVSYLNSGPHKGQFIAVFTHDTDTPYVAMALAPTPVGPFSDPQIIYKTTEKERFKSTTYTYNAKAHPHLSSATDILISYNTNTYNYAHNMSDARIYRPRFIRLKPVEE